MIYGFLLLLASFAHQAISMLIDLNPTITANTSNHIVPQCFNPDIIPDIAETNLNDCRDALLILARNPDFTIPLRFSKNPRRGIKIPRGWTSHECMIIMSCENDRDAYTLRFADVLVVAKRVVDNCVGTKESEKWGLLRWGGVDVLGDSETFYVSVGKPHTPTTSAGIVNLVELANGTLLNSAIGGSGRNV